MMILTHLKYRTPTFKILEAFAKEGGRTGMDVTLNSFACLILLEHIPGVRYCVKET